MPSPFVTSIVTTQFNAKGPELAVNALRSMRAVGIAKCLLQYDTKDVAAEGHAKAAKMRLRRRRGEAAMTVKIQAVDEYSTARRWRPGLQLAFKDPAVVAGLVFPGDLRAELSPAQVQTMQQMLADADENTLILGDYDTDDRFKDGFDRLVADDTLRLTYPVEAKHAQSLKLSKMRTEVFVVGRRVYEAMRKNLLESWGTDPTPQLIINTLRHPEFRIKTAHLGKLGDDNGTRKAAGQVQQIVRFFAQLVNDRIIRDSSTAETEEDQLVAYDRLRVCVEEAAAITLRALDENRLRIAAQANETKNSNV